MSYKHNDLWAMRERYWHDANSEVVLKEKHFLQTILQDSGVFAAASLEDAKYLFFSLPSVVIVKGYALGFQHQQVQALIVQHIQRHKLQLQQRNHVKIQYKI